MKLKVIISTCFLLFSCLWVSGQPMPPYDYPWNTYEDVKTFCTKEGYSYPAGVASQDLLYFIPDDPVQGLDCIKGNALYFGDELRYVPAWFIFRVGSDGMIHIGIEHTFNTHENPDFDPTYPDMTADVDFICWGPFNGDTKEEVLDNIYNGLPNSLKPVVVDNIALPTYNDRRCSSINDALMESCVINKAKKDEWYLLLITNFNQKPGDITFKQVSGNGSISCGEVEGIKVDPIPVCEGGPLRLFPIGAPAGATFVWEAPAGITLTSAQKTAKELVFDPVTPAHSGVYKVTMSVGDFSRTYDSEPVSVNKIYKDAPVVATIKKGESFEFAGETYTETTNKTIKLSSSTGCDSTVTLNLTVLEPEILPNEPLTKCPGDFPFEYRGETFTEDGEKTKTITIVTGANQPNQIVTVIVTVDNTVPEITSLKSSAPGVCGEKEVELTATTIPQNDITLEWFLDNTSIGTGNSVSVTPRFGSNIQAQHTYTVKATYAGCNNSVDASITLYVDKELTGEIDGKSQICRGTRETILLDATSFNADSYRWTNETGIVELSTGPSFSIAPPPIATTTYRVEIKRGMCQEIQYFTVEVVDPPMIERIDSIGYLDREIIPVPNTGAEPLRFAVNNETPNEEPRKYNLGLGSHTFYIIDASNCKSDVIRKTISALQPLFPTFFSPNGDGINDIWIVGNLKEYYPDADIEIYDRSGRLLAKYKGTDEGWDGTVNGKPVPATDYWYLVNIESLDKMFIGHFTLKRR